MAATARLDGNSSIQSLRVVNRARMLVTPVPNDFLARAGGELLQNRGHLLPEQQLRVTALRSRSVQLKPVVVRQQDQLLSRGQLSDLLLQELRLLALGVAQAADHVAGEFQD